MRFPQFGFTIEVVCRDAIAPHQPMSDKLQSASVRYLKAQLRRLVQPQVWGAAAIISALGLLAWEYFSRPVETPDALAEAIAADRDEGLSDEERAMAAEIDSSDVIDRILSQEAERPVALPVPLPENNDRDEESSNPLDALVESGRNNANNFLSSGNSGGDRDNAFADLTPVGLFANYGATDNGRDRTPSPLESFLGPSEANSTARPPNQLQQALDERQAARQVAEQQARLAEEAQARAEAEAAASSSEAAPAPNSNTAAGNTPYAAPGSTGYTYPLGAGNGTTPQIPMGSTGYTYTPYNYTGNGYNGYNGYNAPNAGQPINPYAVPNATGVPTTPTVPGNGIQPAQPANATPQLGNYNSPYSPQAPTVANPNGMNTGQLNGGVPTSPYTVGNPNNLNPTVQGVPRRVPGRYLGNGEINTFANP